MGLLYFFKFLLPPPIKSRIRSIVLDHYQRQYNQDDPEIIYEFSEEHLKNTQVLPDRIKMIEQLPPNGRVAEIGVDMGLFSAKILKHCCPAKLYLIDTWASVRYNNDKMLEVRKKFKDLIENNSVVIVRKDSVEAAQDFEEKYFDWVYIDTDHSYETTLRELYAYKDKIKDGGCIAGHDFVKGNVRVPIRYGVKEAVAAFCTKENWELMYISLENNENSSFAIKKIR